MTSRDQQLVGATLEIDPTNESAPAGALVSHWRALLKMRSKIGSTTPIGHGQVYMSNFIMNSNCNTFLHCMRLSLTVSCSQWY